MKTPIPYVDTIDLAELCIDGLLACDCRVKVAFTHSPGRPARTTGPWEDCYPAEDAEFSFASVKAVGDVWFFNGEDDFPVLKFADGDELLARLDDKQIELIEDVLLDQTITGASNE